MAPAGDGELERGGASAMRLSLNLGLSDVIVTLST
jgi:hypothetical protein